MLKKLWRILRFPVPADIDRAEISAEKWTNFDDFLTSGSDGVFVALVKSSNIKTVRSGNLVVIDTLLAPAAGDVVAMSAGEEILLKQYSDRQAFGVVTCVVVLLDSHRRQRTLRQLGEG